MIRVDALWLSTRPQDMRAGTETILAQVVRIFGEARPHQGRFQLRMGDGSVALTRAQFDALILGLPWEQLADGGVIRIL